MLVTHVVPGISTNTLTELTEESLTFPLFLLPDTAINGRQMDLVRPGVWNAPAQFVMNMPALSSFTADRRVEVKGGVPTLPCVTTGLVRPAGTNQSRGIWTLFASGDGTGNFTALRCLWRSNLLNENSSIEVLLSLTGDQLTAQLQAISGAGVVTVLQVFPAMTMAATATAGFTVTLDLVFPSWPVCGYTLTVQTGVTGNTTFTGSFTSDGVTWLYPGWMCDTQSDVINSVWRGTNKRTFIYFGEVQQSRFITTPLQPLRRYLDARAGRGTL